MISDKELEGRISKVLQTNLQMFTEMGLKPDDPVVCDHTARYIMGLLELGKDRLKEDH